MSITHNRRIRVEVAAPDADPHIPSLFARLPDHRLARARDLRLLRHHLRRPSRADPHRNARRLGGAPATQGLPVGRHPRGVPRRRDPAARRAEGLQLMSTSTTPPESGGTDTVVIVGGQDWDQVVAAAARGRSRRRTHRRQHGPAAPVHARRAAADPRDRGRDHHRGPLRNRLPAHRHREEPRVPQLDPGRHVRDPNGLPLTAFQRNGVLPRRREAARRHRRHPRARQRHPRDDDGAQPDLVASGRAGDRRDGTGRHGRDVLRVPRARADPVDLRDDHRAADEQRLHPARRAGRRPARRGASRRSATCSS